MCLLSILKPPFPKVWGLVREVARDGECVTWMDGTVRGWRERDGTWTEGTGRHVDGGDETVPGRGNGTLRGREDSRRT